MQNKLQELTDRLYSEGLSKGKQEGEEILRKAREEAEAILSGAKEEAEAIRVRAQKEAEELKAKTQSDLKMASAQALTATKHDLETVVVAKLVEKPIKEALADSGYLKEIITAVAKGFSATEASDIALVLPESLKKKLEPFVSKELSAILGKGVDASFSKKVAGGFTIGPKDGGYFISFTDETFRELISEYLRPATRKLLFGE